MRPPRTEEELLERALALAGLTLGEVAATRSLRVPTDPSRAKGFAGQLLEAVLGASAGGRAEPDFPALGVELKSVPVDAAGRPREGTFVCVAPLDAAVLGPWEESWVRRKLARVLWVPLVRAEPATDTMIGTPGLWSPDPREAADLRADYDELLSLLAAGEVGRIDGRLGRVLQLRPKASDGAARTWTVDEDGRPVRDTPRGFYLRPAFTAAVLSRLHAAPC